MKLSNYLRDGFIRAAMGDVPKTDFQAKAIKLILADAVAQLPPKVRAIYNDPALKCFLRHDSNHFALAYVSFPCAHGTNFKLTDAAQTELSRLKVADTAQDETDAKLRSHLRAVAYACTTRKALLDALPEFEKYLPADETAVSRQLPAVANVVSDFIKAGWPKGTAKSTTKKQGAR